MKLEYTEQAIGDLKAIADYLKPRNPRAAIKARAAILDMLQNLCAFPHLGRRQTAHSVRKLSLHKYKYLIYYHVDDAAEIITILTIRHSSRTRAYTDN
jgi:toxin ParE1/3/4